VNNRTPDELKKVTDTEFEELGKRTED